jgi:hypothetical protein
MRGRLFGWTIVTAMALVFATVGAASTIVETHAPFSATLTNTCRAETFTATGFIHTKATFVQSNGGSTLFSVESNLQDVKAFALTGARYVVTESTSDHLLIDPENGPNNGNLVFKQKFVRQGDDGSLVLGDDFSAYFRVHMTINSNGTMTVNRMESGNDPCQ